MKKWIVFLIILLILNGIMAITYVKKRNQAIKFYKVLMQEPTLEDYFGSSASSRDAIAYYLSPKYPRLKDQLATSSEILDQSLRRMEANLLQDEDWSDFFKNTQKEPIALSDSLWNSWIEYRDAVKEIIEESIQTRKHSYQHARAIYNSYNGKTKGKNLVSKQSWDSLRYHLYRLNDVKMEDSTKVNQYLQVLKVNSDTEVAYINTLLAKGDSFFITRGKANLYGHTYTFAELTPEEARMIMRYLIVLKGNLDSQLVKILNDLPHE